MTPPAITALEQRAHLEWTRVAEGRVAWRRFGAGSPLVLLHGGHGSWLHWVRNIDDLCRAGHQVLVPDMPGFGDSDAPAGGPHGPDRLGRLVAMLAAGLDDRLGAGMPFDLAGFSFGGLVAAHLVATRPGVRRLALLGPAGHGSPRRPREPLHDWRVPDPAAMHAALRHNLQAHMLADARRVDELALEVHERSCRRTRFHSKDLALAASLREVLAGSRVPVLLLFGEHDVTATPTEAASSLASIGPWWQGVVEPDAGHWVQFEQPESVNRRLAAWFG